MFESRSKRISYMEILDLLDLSDLAKSKELEKFSFDTSFRPLSSNELDKVIFEVLTKIDSGFSVSGPKRATDWEKGWNENKHLFEVSAFDVDKLKPKYYRSNNLFRWRGKYVYSKNDNLEYEVFQMLREIIFKNFLAPSDTVFEFGCGSAHNLVAVAKMFPNAQLVGCDWAESAVKILESLRTEKGLNVEGKLFDFFYPDFSLNVPANSVFLTIGGLEQIGENFEDFLKFILDKKPRLCIHIEPISEFYDPNVYGVIDYLAIKFHESRNYLKGFMTAIEVLENNGMAKIVKKVRFPFGGKFHEGWSVIAWQPQNSGTFENKEQSRD